MLLFVAEGEEEGFTKRVIGMVKFISANRPRRSRIMTSSHMASCCANGIERDIVSSVTKRPSSDVGYRRF